ncbi:MAG: hypothetical protein BLM47_10835 [Candidatus Reconcilbacillus cellulovorans]|uniref:DUF6922 domain-containing protein n=1 Tax=Candidatus Reconcilbacillus cellulovorans TaxID=1906605 RepID=A0A2A6DYA2_9BACL|nr:MAG: hypothetical protein BLM47_10835 [Candidatus Reconcilbacillus cellulovorans]
MKERNGAAAVLPESFRPFFWDVRFEEIDLNAHKTFVIERLMNEGDHRALLWLLRTFTADELRAVVVRSRRLTKKTARFWQVYFGLDEVDMRCFGTSSTEPEFPF